MKRMKMMKMMKKDILQDTLDKLSLHCCPNPPMKGPRLDSPPENTGHFDSIPEKVGWCLCRSKIILNCTPSLETLTKQLD